MTLRDLIGGIQQEVSKGDLMPERAAELLNQLSALIGNVNDQIMMTDAEYNKVLLHNLDNEKKANRAKIIAESSPEFMAKQQARNTKELVIEMQRSLKYYLTAKKEEQQASRFLRG